MAIAVLGPLTVDGSQRLGPRDRVVLQALATRPGRPVSAEELMDALWADHPPVSAAKNLQSCVVRLRKTLGAAAISTSAHGYALMLPADGIDALEFEAQAARARELLAVGEADRVVFLLEKALALWRGHPFSDLPDWPPAQREAGRLGELRLEVEEMYLDALIRSGRPREVLARGHAMVRAAPLRERRWELLALAQYQAGAQGEALRTIRQLRAVLAHELGIDPSPEIAALEQSILKQDPGLLVPQPSGPVAHCPWQGLKSYDVEDAERFFGRDTDVQSCLELLAAHSFAAIVGPSGSGKSSIMRAGVLATMRRRGHQIVVITPGRRPTDGLTALPADADARTVLAVDQAEEVFALCEDLEERRDFLEQLAREATRRPVVVTLRGDRLTQVTEDAGFSRLVERGLHLVGAMDEEALRETVTGPAQQAGLILEPGLVDLLVREVRDDPGALPLLSHALVETWRRREGNTLTVDGYQATGGIHGAVAQSAEQLYGQVGPEQRRQLRGLMLRLVSPGVGGEAVRTQVPRRLIASDSQHEQLIAMLVDARLVTSDEGVLEITHEALARAWPRLRGWLDDDVEGQQIRHHLSGAADAWDTLGRPDSELYRGVRLTRALDWQTRTDSALTETEREFLEASSRHAEVKQQSLAERARTQARLIRRLRIVLAGAAVLLVLALIAGGIAAVQSDRANQNAAQAEQAAISADARRVGAGAQLIKDISLPLLLAAAGARLEDSPQTRANLLAVLAKQPLLVRAVPPGGSGFLEVLSVSPDGRWVAASDDQNQMHLYDAATNRLLRSYDAGPTGDGPSPSLFQAFSPDSSQLAVIPWSVESTEPVRLLDTNTMGLSETRLAAPASEPVRGYEAQFSTDGRYLAATLLTLPLVKDDSGEDDWSLTPSYAVVWDLRSASTPPIRVPTGTGYQDVALSPDGRTLYTSSPLTAYDVASGEVIWREPEQSVYFLELNAEGTRLALVDAEDDTNVVLVDPATRKTVHTLRGHQDFVRDLRFSPDGSLVGSVSTDQELIVWDTATGLPLERWHTFDGWGVGFSPDNDLVYGGGGVDSMLRTWDPSMEDTYLQQTTQVGGGAEVFTHADISPDGQRVAYSWRDDQDRGWVRFVDTVTGDATSPTRFPVWDWLFNFNVVDAWHPDGGEYFGSWCDGHQPCAKPGTVTVLDSATGRPLLETRDIVDGDRDVWSLGYVDGGRSLLAFDAEARMLLVDAETLQPRGAPLDVLGGFDNGGGNCCTTSIGDGSTAMVHEWDGRGESTHWRVLDISDGEVLSEGVLKNLFVLVSVASPDGSTVAVSGDPDEIITIDVATGAQQRRSTGLGSIVLWLKYSDDGELLVSGAQDGGVSLWDATTLDLMGTVYPPHEGDPVPSGAQFIGDTHDVAIASYDGRVYRWETDLDRALDFACQMAGRTLTEEEWEQFLPAQPYQSVCPRD